MKYRPPSVGAARIAAPGSVSASIRRTAAVSAGAAAAVVTKVPRGVWTAVVSWT
jgi:hypothetical protein